MQMVALAAAFPPAGGGRKVSTRTVAQLRLRAHVCCQGFSFQRAATASGRILRVRCAVFGRRAEQSDRDEPAAPATQGRPTRARIRRVIEGKQRWRGAFARSY